MKNVKLLLILLVLGLAPNALQASTAQSISAEEIVTADDLDVILQSLASDDATVINAVKSAVTQIPGTQDYSYNELLALTIRAFIEQDKAVPGYLTHKFNEIIDKADESESEKLLSLAAPAESSGKSMQEPRPDLPDVSSEDSTAPETSPEVVAIMDRALESHAVHANELDQVLSALTSGDKQISHLVKNEIRPLKNTSEYSYPAVVAAVHRITISQGRKLPMDLLLYYNQIQTKFTQTITDLKKKIKKAEGTERELFQAALEAERETRQAFIDASKPTKL